jgi:hypothetical protein
MKNYIKANEIEAAKSELQQVREEMKIAAAREAEYRGQHEDIVEHARLRSEQVRIVDLIDELKDHGKEAA